MNRILLDTSGYSRWSMGHPEAVQAVQRAEEVVMCPIVLGELLSGFRRGRNRRRNEDQLEEFLSSTRVDTAVLDRGTADRYAVILDGLLAAGSPIPANDIWIAASAMQLGLVVVTLDRHFLRIPQIVTDLLGAVP